MLPQAVAIAISPIPIVLMIVVLVASTAVLGERVRPALAELRSWLLANNATIVSVVFLLLGAKMLGSGLALAG